MSFKKVGWDFTPLILFFRICVWHMIDDIRCLFSFFSLKISFARFFLQICVFSWSITCGILLSLFICRFLFDALKFPSAQAEMVFTCRISGCFSGESAVFSAAAAESSKGNCSLQFFSADWSGVYPAGLLVQMGQLSSISMCAGFWFKLVFSRLF